MTVATDDNLQAVIDNLTAMLSKYSTLSILAWEISQANDAMVSLGSS